MTLAAIETAAPVPPLCCEYRQHRFYPHQVAAFALLGLWFLKVEWDKVHALGPGSVFLALLLLGWLFNAYWLLGRVAHQVTIEGGILRWRSPLAQGSIPLVAVQGMRSTRLGWNVQLIEVTSGRPLPVVIGKGFVEFTEAITAARPLVSVAIGKGGQFADQVGVGGGFRHLSSAE